MQAALPETMYVFPVASDAALPADWAKCAKVAEKPYAVSPEDIAANRDEWLKQWTDLTSR